MDTVNIFQNVLKMEADALLKAANRINPASLNLLELFFKKLRQNNASLYFSGVGKSGFIALKLASTFTSVGLPSHFLHPVEALHGDLGRLKSTDGLVIISKSGTTQELLKLLPFVKTPKENIIGLLGNTTSPLGEICEIIFDCSVEKEACINNQAPTTSSTLAMAMGDAMAVFFEKLIGLDKYGFAINHPGGLLGKSLRLKVKNLMIPFEKCATCTKEETLKDILLLMTQNPQGACAVLNDDNALVGLIVEGDIRRSLMMNVLTFDIKVLEIMNCNPIKIDHNELAISALELMEKRKNPIYVIPVVDEKNIFQGVIRMHDLIREGFNSK